MARISEIKQSRRPAANLLARLKDLATKPEHFTTVAGLLILAEALLCLVIIRYIKYTEIDFSTYMQQIQQFIEGQRDYSLIKGDTGPIVYPAGFLYVFTAIHWLTDGGKDINLGQRLFAAVYVATLALVLAIFRRCKALPPWTLVLLCISKRLHSLYVLRLFNDCIAMLVFYAALYIWTSPSKKRSTWLAGTAVFSLALSIKMNLLLFLPGLLFILFVTLGLLATLQHVLILVLTQLLLGAPFFLPSLLSQTSSVARFDMLKTYFGTAFDFSREFLWEWTVNWRWLGQRAFEAPKLSTALLLAHILGLVLFALAWSERSLGEVQSQGKGGQIAQRAATGTSVETNEQFVLVPGATEAWKLVKQGFKRPSAGPLSPLGEPSADFICTVLFTSNLIGIAFSRSLHYQFYTWYAHQVVFLLWHSPFDTFQRFGILAAIEFGWEKFPSTKESSLGLTFAHLFILVGAYYGQVTGVGGYNGRSQKPVESVESVKQPDGGGKKQKKQ